MRPHTGRDRGKESCEPRLQLVSYMSNAELKHVHGGHTHVSISLLLIMPHLCTVSAESMLMSPGP
jgi:hypothetical protein